MRRRNKPSAMTHEVVLSSGLNESVLVLVKSEGLAQQLKRTLEPQFESELIIRPIVD